MVKQLVACAAIGAAAFAPPPDKIAPLIIGHRGASGHRPEHTLESYRLAAEMGADFIEPDLVATRDGVLVARHENEIGGTTNVSERYPDRKRTRTIDGMQVTGWFTEDFTLAEIKRLKARERLPFRSHEFDGRFDVPTFAEIIALARQLSADLGRPIGIYPETKHPGYFRTIGLPLEETLVKELAAVGWSGRDAPVFIQSFEASSLRELRRLTQAPLVQLLDKDAAPVTDDRLRDIATYADGIGPNKRLVVPADSANRLLPPTDLVERAHARGLFVHVWTLRSEPVSLAHEDSFLSPSYQGDVSAEYRQFRDLHVDGLFTDFADAAVAALRSR